MDLQDYISNADNFFKKNIPKFFHNLSVDDLNNSLSQFLKKGFEQVTKYIYPNLNSLPSEYSLCFDNGIKISLSQKELEIFYKNFSVKKFNEKKAANFFNSFQKNLKNKLNEFYKYTEEETSPAPIEDDGYGGIA